MRSETDDLTITLTLLALTLVDHALVVLALFDQRHFLSLILVKIPLILITKV